MDLPTTAQAPRVRREFEELPGPRGVPIFGNLLQIDSTRFHLQMEHWADQYGPIYKLRLGPRRAIVIGDHELVAAALRDRPDGFRRTMRLEAIWQEMGMSGGLFGAHGDAWKRQRRMVMASFDPGHVRRFFPQLHRVAERLVSRWQIAAHSGAEIDLQADLMRYTVDAIAGLAFGSDVNTLQSDEDVIQRHLNRIFPALFKRVYAPLPLWRWLPSAEDRALKHSVAEVNAAVNGFIAQARARLQADPALRERPGNLLEAMLVAADEPGSGIDDQQVAGNVLVMLLAGEDTTANTVAWMVHLLWQNPAALARATAEVRRVCGEACAPSLEQVGQLDYIEACAHEAMRLKPVAPQNGMQALRDTTLGDVQVREGQIVICLMRRDSVSERYIPNAEAFEPERWLADSAALSGGSAGTDAVAKAAGAAKRISMPFGAGPRICPGRYLALLEMKMAMAVLLNNFDLQHVGTVDGQAPREKLQLAMAPEGLRMRLSARARGPQPLSATAA